MCRIDAVDGSNISAYTVHECEAINRVGMRSKRFVFTGHINGSIQVRVIVHCGVVHHISTSALVH